MALGRAPLLTGCAVALLLSLGGCGSADPNLFESGPGASGGSGAGNAGGAGGSGTLAGGGNGGESVAGSASNAGSGGSGGSGAGCAFSCGDGGRGGNWGGGGSGDLGGVAGEAGSGSELTECSAFSPDALYLPSTQHCYLVDNEPRTFAAAEEHCDALHAHLVTLSNEAENDFAWSIHGDEHWIGAKDGKKPAQSGVGTYTWITEEPFDYNYWSPNQPNASESGCGEGNGGGSCYEHCAFQWKGGEHDGQWNDRYCLHTIASICEWDSADSTP